MADYSILCVKCDETRIDFRIQTRYVDQKSKNLDQALSMINDVCAKGEAFSVGLLGNGAEVIAELVKRGIKPDLVTDQTSAHDPGHGYLLSGWSMDQWQQQKKTNLRKVIEAARESMAGHVESMLAFHQMGVQTVDYGNNIRQEAQNFGVENAFDFPGFVPAYIRLLFCRGVGPFRWVALSGNPEDIYKTDAKVKELIPDAPHLHNWLDMAQKRIRFQGRPGTAPSTGTGI